MGRFLLLLALLLLGTAIFLLVILVQGADNEWAKLIFQTALCTDGEELVQWTGNYVPRSGSNRYSGYETAFYCEDNEGEQRDVTLQTVGIMGAGFAVPFVISLILFLISISMMVSNRVKSFTKNVFDMSGAMSGGNAVVSQYGNRTVIDLRDGTYQGGEIPPEKLAQVQQIMDSFGLPNFFEGAGGGNTLSERLQQLEDARREGLITDDEYQRLRQSILDDLS
jgi:hypothetical protein